MRNFKNVCVVGFFLFQDSAALLPSLPRVAQSLRLLATSFDEDRNDGGSGRGIAVVAIEEADEPPRMISSAQRHEELPTEFEQLDLSLLNERTIEDQNVGRDGARDGAPNLISALGSQPLLPESDPCVAAVQRVMTGAVAAIEPPKWNLTAATSEPLLPFQGPSVDILKEIRTMTLPLLAVWLSGPILSIIDTAVVGRSSGLVELAGLGPATSMCDSLTYFFNFLCVVTTSQVANSLVQKDQQDASRRVGDGIFAAASLGFIASLLLLSPVGEAAVAAFCSSGGGSAAPYFPVTLEYVRVRALGFVPALAMAVYQSACLARHNIRLPLISVTCAAFANLVLDCVLVLGLGQGAVGAAWGSVAAQVAAFGVLCRHENSLSTKTSSRRLAERCKALRTYLSECAAPSSALFGKSVVTMALMSTASACGAVGLAAHQVCQAVLYIFCPFGEAISQTAQALLPQVNSGQNVKARRTDRRRVSAQAKRLVKSLVGAAAGLGAINAVVAGSIPLVVPGFFTSNLEVMQTMSVIAPWMMGILLFHAVSTLLEGTLFAIGDGAFLGKLYPVNSAIVCSVFWLLQQTGNVSLTSLWATMLCYNFGRCMQFAARFAYNQRRPPLVDGLSS